MEPVDGLDVDGELKRIYYDMKDPGSYGGIDRLYERVKHLGVTRDKVEQFLRDQQSYSLHKPARKRFSRNKIFAGGIDRQWQADLADMQAISRSNKGFNYILIVIDVFSKFVWAIPVKDKGSTCMKDGFEQLFKKAHPRKPIKLQTDKGKEFVNKTVQKVFKDHGVIHFCTNSDQKAAMAERVIRTIKTKIWTYFTAHQTNNYIDVLDDVVSSYNKSKHGAIGMAPIDVKAKHETKIWRRLYGDGGHVTRPNKKLKVDQKVRISNVKGCFDKGYLPNWSEEHFKVKGSQTTHPKHVYKLEDDLGEPIAGTWYKEELQPIEENRFLIEKILRHRKLANGTKEIFVKWKGWQPKFNSWIPETNTYDIE